MEFEVFLVSCLKFNIFQILNAVLFGVLFVAMMLFTAVYCFTDNVDFGNSLWYTFATFTTIGFGGRYLNLLKLLKY